MYQDKNDRERMSYHHFVGGKKDCAELQTQYAKAVESLGFERGVALTGHQNTSLKQARNYLTKDVGAELPLPNPGETLEQYRERANEEYAAVSVQRSALELKNLDLTDKYEKSGLKDKKIKDLEERIEREREKVLAAERERDQMEQKMKSELQRRMCELEGMRNHQDPGMIKEIYVPLQESLVADGMEIFRKNGFILDRNGDGIDDRDQTIDENGNGIDDRDE